MKFNEVENLTENEINRMYDEIVEYNGGNLIAKTGTIWKVECDNGYTGYFHAIADNSGLPVGHHYYECGQYYHNSSYHLCGSGRCAYTTLITHFDDTGTPSLWEVSCTNGNSGYFVSITSEYSSTPVGYTDYRCNGEITDNVCGSGQCGYTDLVSH